LALYQQGMTFEPRDMVEQKGAFGYSGSLPDPAEGVGRDDHRYRAAMVQHIMARQVRDALKLRGVRLATYLDPYREWPGFSASRMGRVLRGTQSATFADLAFWTAEFPRISEHIAKYMATWKKPEATDAAPPA
jgi:hypothetical protein